jgi:hypothetical protein
MLEGLKGYTDVVCKQLKKYVKLHIWIECGLGVYEHAHLCVLWQKMY